MMQQKLTTTTEVAQQEFMLVLDNLPAKTTETSLQKLFATRKLKFQKIEVLDPLNSIRFGNTGHLSAKVQFQTKADLVKASDQIVNKTSFRIGHNQLQMRILKDTGHYNPETSVVVTKLHTSCSEQDLISEINRIFKYNLVYRKEIQKWEMHASSSKGKKPQAEHLAPYYVLSCMVFADQTTGKSKCFAFIDLNSPDATQVLIKAWHGKAMEKYLNQLECYKFEHDHQKLDQVQKREVSMSGERKLSSLYVENVPAAFVEQNVFDLFSLYGEVVSVKMKRSAFSMPQLTCQAYVAYSTHEEATKAIDSLNNKVLLPGMDTLKVSLFNPHNQLQLKGLDRQQLLQNTHFRVLFIRGLSLTVTKQELKNVCEKYGCVEAVTLKTNLEQDRVTSRGQAIVQFGTKEGASSALKNLVFEEALGDPTKLSIDFYQSRESRIQEKEQETLAHSMNKSYLSGDTFTSNSLQLSPPLIQAFSQALQRLSSDPSDLLTESSSDQKPQVLQPTMIKPPVRPSDFECPHYLIKPARPVPPPLDLTKPAFRPDTGAQGKRGNRGQNRAPNHQSQRGRKQQGRGKERQRKRSAQRKPAEQQLESGVKQWRPKNSEPVTPFEGVAPKPKQVTFQKDENDSVVSPYHIDLASVYSQRTKDLEEEEHQARKARRESKEAAKQAERSLSWRNPSLKRKDANTTRAQPLQSPAREQVREPSKTQRSARKPVFGVPPKSARSARKGSGSARGGEKGRGHSYSPRYLDWLHQSPHGSPRDDTLVENYVNKPQEPKESRKAQLSKTGVFKQAFQSPIQKNEEAKVHIPHAMSAQNLANMEDVIKRVNDPDFKPNALDANYFNSPVRPSKAPAQIQSPQPCVSPSSLINNLYGGKDEGLSAPIVHNFKMDSESSKNKGASKPAEQPFGMFNWEWDSSSKSDNDEGIIPPKQH